MRKPLHITFADSNPMVIHAIDLALDLRAFRERTIQLPGIVFQLSRTIDVEADAFVSPANGFGWMECGIDRAYANKWPDAQAAVHSAIDERPLHELLVGEAVTVVVDKGKRYLIVAPTMRLPYTKVTQTDVMLATRAAVRQAWSNYSIGSLVIPGMGTGSGGLSPHEGAAAMLHGIEQAAGGMHPYPRGTHWTRIRGEEAMAMKTPAGR